MLPNEPQLLYSQNVSVLHSTGFNFQEFTLESSAENYQKFNVTLTVQETMNGTKIRCTARMGELLSNDFNEYIIVFEKGTSTELCVHKVIMALFILHT